MRATAAPATAHPPLALAHERNPVTSEEGATGLSHHLLDDAIVGAGDEDGGPRELLEGSGV